MQDNKPKRSPQNRSSVDRAGFFWSLLEVAILSWEVFLSIRARMTQMTLRGANLENRTATADRQVCAANPLGAGPRHREQVLRRLVLPRLFLPWPVPPVRNSARAPRR